MTLRDPSGYVCSSINPKDFPRRRTSRRFKLRQLPLSAVSAVLIVGQQVLIRPEHHGRHFGHSQASCV